MQNQKVLVVDDEELVALALAEMLKFLGFEPSVCTTADQALNLTKVHPFHLVFTDIRMPGTDGLAFYRFLSIVDISLAQRLIFVTGDYGNPETREWVDRTGAVCLVKPVHFDELERAIAETLARARRDRDVPDARRPTYFVGASDPEPASGNQQPEAGIATLGVKLALTELEQEWRNALVSGHLEAIDRLLASDFVATHHLATVWAKADYLASLKRRTAPPVSMLFEDLHVRVHAECAIVTAKVSAQHLDQEFPEQYRLTHTWVKRMDKWCCIASHASMVMPDASSKPPLQLGTAFA